MKILIPMIILPIIVAIAILLSTILQITPYVDSVLEERVDSASNVSNRELDFLKSESESSAMGIANNMGLITALENADRDALLASSKSLMNDTGVEFLTVTDPHGNVLVRAHEPDNFGDNLSTQYNIQSALSGRGVTVIEEGSAVRLSLRSGRPVYNRQNDIIGVVSVGYRLDTSTFVDLIKSLNHCEATIFLRDERISTTVTQPDGTRAIGTKASHEIASAVLNGKTYIGHAQILGNDALAKYVPIYGPENEIIGMLFVGLYTEEQAAVTRSFVTIGVIITVILLAITIPVVLYITSRITTPIKAVVAAANTLSKGDTDVDVQVNSKDETHELAIAFDNIVENTRNQIRIVEDIAVGDLTVVIKPRSEKDAMNFALEKMVASLNQMFRDINTSTTQVANGSKQVADGAQSLAQGSTEQAASIEELSSSIAEIAQKTKRNAETADKTAKLADSIIGNAEKGSQQMDEMMSAVQEINQASQNISKVIKVIDDIAFQTNILALNAAVEAARAGQHGKGFAVVAEEVRNLASKSAEAAKETGSMIENSIEKAELGSRIAGETASSLMEIVTGISESNEFIREIATASEEQSLGIDQINIGIDQVAQVVQQNSATAEESAAASEEMSSLSSTLHRLISQFKLKAGDAQISLPAAQTKTPVHHEPVHDDTVSYSNNNDFGKY